MAVPELGQIRIIPDFLNYEISLGKTITAQDNPVPVYAFLDHRRGNRTTWDNNGSWSSGNDVKFYSTGATSSDRKVLFIVDYHNIHTSGGTVVLQGLESASTSQTTGYTSILNATGTNGLTPTSTGFCVSELSSGNTIVGFILQQTGTFTTDPYIGILHMGEIFEIPTNATASLSYNTKYQNKVNTAFSGASYSTLYNTKPQRVLSASWEYINWSTGSSGIDDFTTMMNQCFGSHIPVALQLSQDGSITSDYFMFARITKWNQTQMSPNLWKVSAEFTEFI